MPSFDAFYSDDHERVLGMLFAMTGDWVIAEELTQEAFARAYERWEKVAVMSRPDAWVRTVAVNLLRSKARRRQAERRARARLQRDDVTVDPEPLPYELERFWAEVRKLPRQQAIAVTLNYLEDRQPSEMAEILGCSPSTARVHLHRARQRLQRAVTARQDERDLA